MGFLSRLLRRRPEPVPVRLMVREPELGCCNCNLELFTWRDQICAGCGGVRCPRCSTCLCYYKGIPRKRPGGFEPRDSRWMG